MQPKAGQAFCLALPEPNMHAMQVFLDQFDATSPAGEVALVVMNQAGRHVAGGLAAPPNASIVWLPSYTPEPNPIERVWLCLRKRHLSRTALKGCNAIIDAFCTAWNKPTPEQLQTLTEYLPVPD